MWKMNNLRNEILKYFLLFSFVILACLWIFQFLFFNSFYKEQKINDVKFVGSKIRKYQSDENFEDLINSLALDKSVCIEIDNNHYDSIYHSSYFGKGCISNIQTTYQYKFDFLQSHQEEKIYTFRTSKDNTETIVYAIQLKQNRYAFINASLQPVDGMISLIRKQLIVISLFLVLLSFVLAYFISKHISLPIKKINEEAKNLAKGKFDIAFSNSSSILELQELSDTLNYAKEELNKTEEYRRDLMANVSHDLKTPLTMIKANAEIAKDLHLGNKKKQIEDMDTIIFEADRLTILVNDILTLSKMESIKEKLDMETFDLIKLIYDILSQYKVLQEREKYIFEFIHEEEEVMIQADKKRIEQVIYNLINNAINYTGDDNKVIIRVLSQSDIRVEICDTGKGIKEEDIPYIWDKYYKNQKKHKRNLIGTGLGLSIVKKILEDHHFTYGVDSRENVGTTFYFQISKK